MFDRSSFSTEIGPPLRRLGSPGGETCSNKSASPLMLTSAICVSESHGAERSLTSDRRDDGIAFRSPAATISERRNPARSNLLRDDSESRKRTNASAPAAFSATGGASKRLASRIRVTDCGVPFGQRRVALIDLLREIDVWHTSNQCIGDELHRRIDASIAEQGIVLG